MKTNIVTTASGKANAYALFFVKKSVQFSNVLSENAEKQVESVLNGMEDGPFEDLEFLEIDNQPTIFVNAAKERGLSSLDHLRMAAFRLAKKASKRQIPVVSIMLADAAPEQFKSILLGLHYADYKFDAYKSKQKDSFQVTFELVAGEHTAEFKKIADVVAIENKAIVLAKNLINTSSSDLTPAEFVENANTIAKYTPGLSIKVRNMKQLEKEGFMGHVTVGKGSSHEPYMITLSYDGSKSSKKAAKNARTSADHLVFVGKGLTFDTGGLCLKPPKSMPEMISDMSGAATVLAAIQAIATLELPIKVSAVCCLAENAIGNKSVLPGDIFTAKNGKTVMVDNTDAEGRLVLSDGLAEAGLIGATHIVDLATLTGAMVRALGYAVAGFFSNDDDLALKVINCGEACCEKFWSMPLEEEYADALKDHFADLKNTGSDAGAIAAALFLQEFVPENTAWTHWDIAGTAFVNKTWKYTDFGATGFGVQTLIELARRMSGMVCEDTANEDADGEYVAVEA
ncbi:cytosol aminopeptidase family protein [Fibrobacter succinogenes subsp. succinogenes S85]|uniref:Cytosol aminopeptidase family protein n=1 Tax=Fibrobacter succinogenes (strain ATCC 19169 / S85) TaxID=59374 RepID=C9RPN1_FIBSS|nr:leucyl aminopeptidase family protein [Fibrobacter succinogenes]ACX76563.1 Leucyl aminopeptidase [Fibrobacter succinogenes subsp. succinogenes S85]ADL26278.1 cytosol aminopeptidase family protein [Fibrobacter succinogenes subsp. succinogenes S85]